jgi:hypothetical protein
MKNIRDGIKRFFSELSFQDADAGEFLSTYEKMKRLGVIDDDASYKPVRVNSPDHHPVVKRIALISYGQPANRALEYAIETAVRMNSEIDLLLHGIVDVDSVNALERSISDAGVRCQSTQLGITAARSIMDYISSHPSLVFLVASPEDTAVREFLEKYLPQKKGRMPAPLVLIEDRPTSKPLKRAVS